VGKKLLLAWFALHLLAMLFHRWRFGENLVAAMFSGNKGFPTKAAQSQDRSTQRIWALVALIACALLVGWLVNLPALFSR
jgi:cytochrome b